MKKRLLLMLVAVVCLSPSVVFADLSDLSYVGNHLTTWTRSPSGVVSEKASGPDAIGSFGVAPAPTIQAAVPSGSLQNCTKKQKEIQDTNQFIRDTQVELSGKAS